jgi:hypothetical protein
MTFIPSRIFLVYRRFKNYTRGSLTSNIDRFFPDKFPSPVCQICSEDIPDSTEHLLFYCHHKTIVWKESFSFCGPRSTSMISYSLDFYNVQYCQTSGISASMANIWKAHFRSAVDGTPFLWSSIVKLIRKDITQFFQEN